MNFVKHIWFFKTFKGGNLTPKNLDGRRGGVNWDREHISLKTCKRRRVHDRSIGCFVHKRNFAFILLIGNPDVFCLCFLKANFLCWPKTHILFHMTPPLFASISRDSLFLAVYMSFWDLAFYKKFRCYQDF